MKKRERERERSKARTKNYEEYHHRIQKEYYEGIHTYDKGEERRKKKR